MGAGRGAVKACRPGAGGGQRGPRLWKRTREARGQGAGRHGLIRGERKREGCRLRLGAGKPLIGARKA